MGPISGARALGVALRESPNSLAAREGDKRRMALLPTPILPGRCRGSRCEEETPAAGRRKALKMPEVLFAALADEGDGRTLRLAGLGYFSR